MTPNMTRRTSSWIASALFAGVLTIAGCGGGQTQAMPAQSLTLATPAPRPDAHVVAVRDQAVFTVFDTTTGTTPRLMADLEKLYGRRITTRTWKMVHRIAAAFAA